MAATNFDWCLCIFCQTDLKGEPLQNPSTWKCGNSGDGYLSVSSNIQKFEGINSLPMSVDRTLIGETNEIGKLLKSNQACWHTRCKTKFSNIRLQRAEARLEKQYAEDSLGPSSSKITRRSCGRATDTNQEKCFFCDEVSGELHKASTFNMDKKVRKCALDLQDTILLAKLSAGDLVSQDAVYHTKCLVSLYNRARPTQSGEELADSRKQLHGIVLAELVCYIEEARTETERVTVFKLSELSKLYQSRIKQLDSSVSDTVNSTHLKNRILSNFPEMHAHRKGRDVLLAFEDDIGGALKEVSKVDYDSDALILKQAATIIRKDIFEHNCVFEGQFSSECQQESVPTQLLSFVNMVIRGASIKEQSKQATEQQAPLTIAQLIQFNAVQRRREQGGMYHMAEREPPLPVYLGLLLHGETRKKGTINKVYDLGLLINYNRALAISTELGNQVCARFHDENVVCPPKLRRGIFTTSAVDNIDHNPSSSLAQGSFHGTGISLFQHPSTEGEGVPLDDRTPVTDIGYGKSLSPLPEFYTVVPPVAIPKKDIIAPEAQSDHLKRQCNTIGEEINAEYRWLEHVYDELQSESSNDMKTSWAAFHCNIHRNDRPLDTSALLPLFPEEAKSSAMIRHSMDIVTKTVEYLNPGQVPVMTCDQPLYAVAKQVQWYFKDTHGENRLVVILGGLHIEMAALKAAGNWLEGSGWTSALVHKLPYGGTNMGNYNYGITPNTNHFCFV